MAKPVILTVDDDREVLNAIERDLRAHYRNDYRVVKAASGAEALETLREFKRRNTAVALLLVDQRMPGMSGTELLREAKTLHPGVRSVLLTAYADINAAIASINEVGLNHYLMKPWDPPEERLYPVLDEQLLDWKATVRLPFEGVRVAGSRWSPGCFAAREFLSRNRVPYEWIDIERDADARARVEEIAGPEPPLPVVLFPDGSFLVQPAIRDLADKVGIVTRADRPFYDLVIVGGGPAGLANAVYGASEGLGTLLIEQSAPGGQAGTSSRIENYLGFPAGVSGEDLAQRAILQARKFGAEMVTAQEVVGIRRHDPYRIVELADGSEVVCYAVLLATGMTVRTLGVPGVAELVGAGVYYGAAMTDAAAYRDLDVCIVGGANSAGQAALFFARHARTVTIVIRGEKLHKSMSWYLVSRMKDVANIRLETCVEVAAAKGAGHLEQIVLRHVVTGEERPLDVSAMFIFIGQSPRSQMVAGLVERDESGFILTGPDLPRGARRPKSWTLERDPFLFETSVPGVFAAGDVRAGANRRVAAAVGEGSAAIYTIQRYLETV
jgi:thioredoxin reductase (NADPH)